MQQQDWTEAEGLALAVQVELPSPAALSQMSPTMRVPVGRNQASD